jgi:predicted DNA-binding transcriptional regulator
MQIDTLLQDIGFSKNEAKVYIASLGLGIASAQEIAKQADLPRTTVYSVLEYLVARGVVGKTVQQGKMRFLAEPPYKLLSILNELRAEVEKSLPQLEALYNRNETKPKIIFYEGKGAIRKMFDDTLEVQPKEILMWNSNDYFDFEKYSHDKEYIDTRVQLGIHAKRICGEGSLWHTKHKPRDAQELSETCVVPKQLFAPGIEVNIYANKVVFMNFAENNGIIIESRAIADAMRQVYHLSWLGARSTADDSQRA